MSLRVFISTIVGRVRKHREPKLFSEGTKNPLSEGMVSDSDNSTSDDHNFPMRPNFMYTGVITVVNQVNFLSNFRYFSLTGLSFYRVHLTSYMIGTFLL